jgi:hypothetical protein
MTQKRSYKQYPKEFKGEAVALVLEQGYSVPEAAKSLGAAVLSHPTTTLIKRLLLHLFKSRLNTRTRVLFLSLKVSWSNLALQLQSSIHAWQRLHSTMK